MRTKPQIEHDAQGFGTKGEGDSAQSLAETLLTGKPLAKPNVKRIPKLRARPKPLFGRKAVEHSTSVGMRYGRWSAMGLAVVFVAVLCAQLIVAS